jgi:predicted nuclease of predicted toxin-antitoxin system
VIIDAQLPVKLAEVLLQCGHDAIHTLHLPLRNSTPDGVIRELSEEEKRIVISKDTDFLGSHLVSGIPQKLLLIRTGNIKNRVLLDLFRAHHKILEEHFLNADLIELHATELVVHKR